MEDRQSRLLRMASANTCPAHVGGSLAVQTHRSCPCEQADGMREEGRVGTCTGRLAPRTGDCYPAGKGGQLRAGSVRCVHLDGLFGGEQRLEGLRVVKVS